MYFASASDMERLDELAVANGLEILQMMELAGWHMVGVFETLQVRRNSRIVVVIGKGNKGGDGLAAARHLFNYGYKNISGVLVSEDIKPDSAHHRALLQKMTVPLVSYQERDEAVLKLITDADIVIDALLGYHLRGNPRGKFAHCIQVIADVQKTVIAYDMPSGVDASGRCYKPCITASATLTLALPKKLFQKASGKKHSGRVFLGDIGIPAFLYDQVKPGSRPMFAASGIIEL